MPGASSSLGLSVCLLSLTSNHDCTSRLPSPFFLPLPSLSLWSSSSLSTSLFRESFPCSSLSSSSERAEEIEARADRRPFFSLSFLSFPSRSSPPSHEWSKVTMGVWQKYPNPSSTHVTCVDTIDRSVDPLTGIIRTSVPFLSLPSLRYPRSPSPLDPGSIRFGGWGRSVLTFLLVSSLEYIENEWLGASRAHLFVLPSLWPSSSLPPSVSPSNSSLALSSSFSLDRMKLTLSSTSFQSTSLTEMGDQGSFILSLGGRREEGGSQSELTFSVPSLPLRRPTLSFGP